MSVNIVVPEMGESIVDARVAKWLKNEGEPVSAGEALVELETDKVDVEVAAPKAGVLEKIAHGKGDDVKIGDVLGTIGDSVSKGSPEAEPAPPAAAGPTSSPRPAGAPLSLGSGAGPALGEQGRLGGAEAPAAPREDSESSNAGARASGGGAPAKGEAPAAPREDSESSNAGARASGGGAPAKGEAPAAPREDSESSNAGARASGGGAPRAINKDAAATPSARKLAREEKVELSSVKAGGPRVTKSDVEKTLAKPAAEGSSGGSAPSSIGASGAPSPRPQAPRREERLRMSKRRATIARRLVEAQQTAAMLTTFNEVDMTAVMSLRERQKQTFKDKHGVGLGIASFFVKATLSALHQFPRLNAEIQGDEMVLKQYYDIGVAVGAAEGLVVPVLRDADRLSFAQIETGIREFARKAGDGTLTLDDLRGGTFSITNGGVFGSLMSTPILNPPQVGILGLHTIKDRPVGVNGEIVLRPMMYTALTYDHRIVDGAEAVQFLVRIKQLVEDPGVLLIES
jgi:2-oxoglutarate dehydrogenase E2 component (dihydrolipoamide succinyltransferase)